MVVYQVFLLSPLQCAVNIAVEMRQRWREFKEMRKKLREYEEIEISGQSCRGDCEFQSRKVLRLLTKIRPRIRSRA
jgi:hypothetical protein